MATNLDLKFRQYSTIWILDLDTIFLETVFLEYQITCYYIILCNRYGYSTDYFDIVLGCNTYDPTPESLILQIDTVVVHPNYTGADSGFINDLALIHLAQPVVFNRNIAPICLPTIAPITNFTCYATGWGKTAGKSNLISIFKNVYFL